jgi:hypothetical protein
MDPVQDPNPRPLKRLFTWTTEEIVAMYKEAPSYVPDYTVPPHSNRVEAKVSFFNKPIVATYQESPKK